MGSAETAIALFDREAKEYDEWFSRHPAIFDSELKALSRFIPTDGEGLEVGVGTGQFAKALGIRWGVEPAAGMRTLALSRGIEAIDGVAEALPFPDGRFDFVVFVTTLCFVKNPRRALEEARRVLKPDGKIVIGLIDKDSFLGQLYEKSGNTIYKLATFHSGSDVEHWLIELGFYDVKSCQTLSIDPELIRSPEMPKEGHGVAGFCVFCGQKRGSRK